MRTEITQYSRHLEMVLRTKVSDPLPDSLVDIFIISIRNGGLLELDFVREEGVSYNPRPARIGLILINDAAERDPASLAAGFLAASDYLAMESQGRIPRVNKKVHELCKASSLSPAELFGLLPEKSPAIDIALALQLDRVRHRHLGTSEAVIQDNENFLETTAQYIELAKLAASPLYGLLHHWLERFGLPKLRSKAHVANDR